MPMGIVRNLPEVDHIAINGVWKRWSHGESRQSTEVAIMILDQSE